jgi:16S rRNA (cytosine967-C5)-methyltransferase
VKSRIQEARRAISSARVAAFDILLRVERESSYASELLHSSTYGRLATVDHSLTTELVMGVLRWRSLLDSEIAGQSDQSLSKLDAEILTALRLALYQLRWLDRIPARAAINESVELVKRARKRSAAPFVNAVLRKLASSNTLRQDLSDGATTDDSSIETLAASSAHPLWLVERWVTAYGFDATRQICRHNQSVPVTAIRLRRPAAEVQLAGESVVLAPGAFLVNSRRVSRGDITRTSAFRNGSFVIQDEASQLVAALVGHGSHVLDCCAAPGGKTLAIADRNPNATVYAVEFHGHRARLLQKLIGSKNSLGEEGPNIRIIAADARNLPFNRGFDRVLADVPCSGTGTLSRNPEIKWRLTPVDISELQVRQLAILRSAMAQVAPGGRMVYSTCSLEREENEEVVEQSVTANSSLRLVDCAAELKTLQENGELIWPEISSLVRGPYLRTLPGVHPCDGFFAAILEKI